MSYGFQCGFSDASGHTKLRFADLMNGILVGAWMREHMRDYRRGIAAELIANGC